MSELSANAKLSDVIDHKRIDSDDFYATNIGILKKPSNDGISMIGSECSSCTNLASYGDNLYYGKLSSIYRYDLARNSETRLLSGNSNVNCACVPQGIPLFGYSHNRMGYILNGSWNPISAFGSSFYAQ